MEKTNASFSIKSWVELYSDQLYTWAFYKTSDKETAEDLVQETFLAAINSFEKFEGKSEPKTWLLSILKNKIADHFRKVYRSNANCDSIITLSKSNLIFRTPDSDVGVFLYV
ncbi:MAG: RNA polymerase sigma factor [Candidatus Kapaibacterium sp.]